MLYLPGISIDELPVQIAFAGDNTVLTLTGIDSTNLSMGKFSQICQWVSSLIAFHVVLIYFLNTSVVISYNYSCWWQSCKYGVHPRLCVILSVCLSVSIIIIIIYYYDLTSPVCCVCTLGCVLCDLSSPVQTATRFLARIVIFNINFPITKGFPVSTAAILTASFCLLLIQLWSSERALWAVFFC